MFTRWFYSTVDESLAICTFVSRVAVGGSENSCEINTKLSQATFTPEQSTPTGSLTMQLNEVACVLATACKGEEKNFNSRTCAESWNPPLKRRTYCLWSKKAMFVLCVTTTISPVHFKTLIKTPQERKWREMERALRGRGREGFSDKLSGLADIGGYCKYTNNRICKCFFTFCAFYIDQSTYFIL